MGAVNSQFFMQVTSGGTVACFQRAEVVLAAQLNGDWIAMSVLKDKSCEPSSVQLPVDVAGGDVKFAVVTTENNELISLTEATMMPDQPFPVVKFTTQTGTFAISILTVLNLRSGPSTQTPTPKTDTGVPETIIVSDPPVGPATSSADSPVTKPGPDSPVAEPGATKAKVEDDAPIVEEGSEVDSEFVRVSEVPPSEPRVPDSRVPDDFGVPDSEPANLESLRPYEGLLQIQSRRASAMSATRSATPTVAAQPRLDQVGESEQDITSMPTSQVEHILQSGGTLPGWDPHGDPVKDLGYVKIFYSAAISNYDPATLWPTCTLESGLKTKLIDLRDQYVAMHNDGSMLSLSAESQYDLSVLEVWCRQLYKGVVPHGPLLGWARMNGHELYYHIYGENNPPFLMARYPFFRHAFDIMEGVKGMFMQAGLWKVRGLVLPSQMRIPDRSPAALNKSLLAQHFPDEGRIMEDVLPTYCSLKIDHSDYMARGPYEHLVGAPPNSEESFFFDCSPTTTFYMQAKGQFIYAMNLGFEKTKRPRSEMTVDWIRKADVPGMQEFQVLGVFPMEAPSLQGIAKFKYHSGIYCEEAGVKKALFLELRDYPDNMYCRGGRRPPNVLQLFAMDLVPAEIKKSLVTKAPAGQNFEPRRSRPGFVVQGDRPFKTCPHGWVWQEAYNGKITFYYVDDGQTYEFHQHSPDSNVQFFDHEKGEYVVANSCTGFWQHDTVSSFIGDFIREYYYDD
ncbi:unnamed protein product [Symbiodinium sp. CCMP2592]|nr:unnamed protein product [Symbiodinium sp. CCMP2592]